MFLQFIPLLSSVLSWCLSRSVISKLETTTAARSLPDATHMVLTILLVSEDTAATTAPKCHCSQLCLCRTLSVQTAEAIRPRSRWLQQQMEAVVMAVTLLPGRIVSTGHPADGGSRHCLETTGLDYNPLVTGSCPLTLCKLLCMLNK